MGTPLQTYYLIAMALLAVGVLIQGRELINAPEYIKKGIAESQIQIYDITAAFVENYTEDICARIKRGERALAIKLQNGEYKNEAHGQIFGKRGCIAFTNTQPHKDVSKDEVEFINEILGYKGNEAILIAMGDQDKLEGAFGEFRLFSSAGYEINKGKFGGGP